MITKTARSTVMRDYHRDQAVDRLQAPEVTRGKGVGIGAGAGAALGAGTALATRGRGVTPALFRGSMGATAGGALGEAAQRRDSSQREDAEGYLDHYNQQKLHEILRHQEQLRRQSILMQQRQQAEQEAESRAGE